ncbi:MAG: hypothetical protein JRD68_11480 [Deltaproteobacteria bacterium]|nr:hypothetical protein [Deltaproteobacteria bacterium]
MFLKWGSIAAIITVFLFGCGVKAPPHSPVTFLPARVQGLEYHFSEKGLLVLTFKAPDKSRLGKPLKEIGGYYIEWSENAIGPDFCPDCPVEYTRREKIEAVTPAPDDTIWRGVYRYENRLSPGQVYHYRILPLDLKGRYDLAQASTLVVFYDHPSNPPAALTIKTGDRTIALKWPPPDRLINGQPLEDLAGFRIYRRLESNPFELVNSRRPILETSYEDLQVENDRIYYYKVRALRKFHGTWLESESSPVVKAIPADLTPPPPPVNLIGVSTGTGILIRWQALNLADLAGYMVYRRAENEDRFRRIGPALVYDPVFIDRDVKPGQTYYYRVTASDRSRAANESGWTQEISVKFDR